MKKFKELLFLSNIVRVNVAKIHSNYVPILNQFKTFEDLYNYLKGEFGEDKLKKALEKTEKTFNQITETKYIHVVTILDKEYPQKLKDMGSEAPLILYAMGNVSILNKPNIAVIGSTKPDLDSQNFEYKFTREIIEQTERVIVSGLAPGSDKIAHMVAVDSRSETIAFLPCGFNKIEPENHKKIASSIIDTGGCILSTFTPNVDSSQKNYKTRNKYVAAICECCLAFQCSKESGTMTTISFAKGFRRKIATYLPENIVGADFSGNESIVKNYDGFKISSMGDLERFIKYLNKKIKDKLVYKTTNKKQVILKVNPDGQCTFELDLIKL